MKAHRKTDEIKHDVLGEGYREGVGWWRGVVGDGGRYSPNLFLLNMSLFDSY